jgi:hypothetical protein
MRRDNLRTAAVLAALFFGPLTVVLLLWWLFPVTLLAVCGMGVLAWLLSGECVLCRRC